MTSVFRFVSFFVAAAVLSNPVSGQVRLGSKGPYTPPPQDVVISGGADGTQPRATPPVSVGVRLGPHGPYTPKTTGKTSLGQARPIFKPRDPNKPETFKITITPAAEPALPLKYALLPKYQDIKPGNSVPFYYRAVLSWKGSSKKSTQRFKDNYRRWMDEPLSNQTKREVREFLRGYSSLFRALKIATHREKTDWSWRLKDFDGLSAISFLLPEIQEARQLARLVYLKSRLEIAEGRYDDAIATLQMGNKLARDVAEPPTLINDLVGVAIGSMMVAQAREMIASPNSPNLYWALSKLPRPFIDMEPAMHYEMSVPMKLFPSLKDAETADRTPAEWSRILSDAFMKLGLVNTGIRKQRLQARLGVTGLVLKGYPRAKRDLISWGYDSKKVDAMPVGQVVTIHQARIYRYMYQEMMKWSHLPYYQAINGMRKSEQKLKAEGYFGPFGQSREIIPLAALLLPAVWPAQRASARLDSRIAGLQVLEAIRIYAAGHHGKLPETLSDIRKVPVPNNPITAQPFPYHFATNNAVLEIPAPPGRPVRSGWRFEISVKR